MFQLRDRHTGELHCLTRTKSLPVGFLREGGCYRIEVAVDGDRELRLLISDEEISYRKKEVADGKTRMQWEWSVWEYAGEVILTLVDGEEVLWENALDVSPHPYKLDGAEIYRQLLTELQARAEGVMFGKTPAQVSLSHQETACPPIAQFALLRAYMPQLEKTFRNIAETPHRRLVAEREDRAIYFVRQVDARSLRTALRRMPVLAVLGGNASDADINRALMDVPLREHTYNTSPNRYLLMILRRLIQVCSKIQESLLESNLENVFEDDSTQRRSQRWTELCEVFKGRLNRMARSGFLRGVRPQTPDTAALLTIANHPAYAQFDRQSGCILKPRVTLGEDPDKRLALRPTYDLYEYWCFFRLCDAIQQALPQIEWKTKVSLVPGKLLLDLKNGASLQGVHHGANISLTFQQKYSQKQIGNDPYSISKTCIPDFVLKVEDEHERRIVVFDAKYRSASDSIQAALDDMHVYRDAIRGDVNTSAIHAAFILTPSHSQEMTRYYSSEYRAQFQFGGFDLAPGNETHLEVLVAAIKELVEMRSEYLRS